MKRTISVVSETLTFIIFEDWARVERSSFALAGPRAAVAPGTPVRAKAWPPETMPPAVVEDEDAAPALGAAPAFVAAAFAAPAFAAGELGGCTPICAEGSIGVAAARAASRSSLNLTFS